MGLQYDKHEKVRYFVRGKKGFPVTNDGLISFNVKGRCDVDKEFKQVGAFFLRFVYENWYFYLCNFKFWILCSLFRYFVH